MEGWIKPVDKLKIAVLGIIISLLVFLMVHAIFALIFTDYIVGNLENNGLLMLIIIILESISLIVSIFVGILLTDNMREVSIIKTSILAYFSNLILIIIVSYVSLFILYPDVFSEVSGFEIILVLPSVLVYFSVYVLGHPLWLFILSTVSYFIMFIIFLESFYEKKSGVIRYEQNYRY